MIDSIPSPTDAALDASTGDVAPTDVAPVDGAVTPLDGAVSDSGSDAGPSSAPPSTVTLVGGGVHECAMTSAGGVLCWGLNLAGQLGDGTNLNRRTPVAVTGLTDAVDLAAGTVHTCARRASGTVVCWGNNLYGQLGNGFAGPSTHSSVPVEVMGLTDAVEIEAGGHASCARRRSGSVVCWGTNGAGQLGDGSTIGRLVPTPVSGLSDAMDLAMGDGLTCARRASGGVVCWGVNTGDGTSTRRTTPVPVLGLTDAIELTAGSTFACARRAAGSVVCWGDNARGQLGDGSTTTRLSPVVVTGLSDAVELSAGDYHVCARRTSGAIQCWGNNGSGQLGDGTAMMRSAPVTVVGGLSDADLLGAGGSHTCAHRVAGPYVCWGSNNSGQLGNGLVTPTPVTSPVGVLVTPCPTGTTNCLGTCAFLGSDPANCLACGTVCAATDYCHSSTGCTACGGGRTRCGSSSNACLDLSTDPVHCGTCGNACPTTYPHGAPNCAAGTCGQQCARGFGDCDRDLGNGCETALGTDLNCLACGNACPAGQTCVEGGCR